MAFTNKFCRRSPSILPVHISYRIRRVGIGYVIMRSNYDVCDSLIYHVQCYFVNNKDRKSVV